MDYLSALGGPGFQSWADWTTMTATRIKIPPATWARAKRSPSNTTASNTVTTGSHVLSSDDRAAPIRGSAARKSDIATIVGITAMPNRPPTGRVEEGGRGEPGSQQLGERGRDRPAASRRL